MEWPFWVPTPPSRIEQALDLAELGPGERFVDLGCGDGRVLLAAAQRGAIVTGVELDASRAAEARRGLEVGGVTGVVVHADFGEHDLSGADVVFAFLSPATLQRLGPKLTRLDPGTRIVTVEFGVVGWQPAQVEKQCFLYRMPPRSAPAERPGWASEGAVAGLRAGTTTLTATKLHHPAGRVEVSADAELGAFITVHTGTDVLDAPSAVAVDLRWSAREPGTVASGIIDCAAIGALAVFGIYTEGETGWWGLSDRASDEVAAALADPGCRPDALLDRVRRSIGKRFSPK